MELSLARNGPHFTAVRLAAPFLSACASADVSVIDHASEAEIGSIRAVLVGDEIELSGRVILTDPALGRQTAEFYVERRFSWGGLIGAAMMSDPEASLSKGFTESVCEEVFGGDPY